MSSADSKPANVAGFATTARASVTFDLEQAARVNRAAEKSGETVMSFIRSATIARAERVLGEEAA